MSNTILFLGSSAATPKEGYFHSSFFLEIGETNMLVDTMGGYDIWRALAQQKITKLGIKNIFITHPALDHAMGLFWLLWEVSLGVRNDRLPDEQYRLRILCSTSTWGILYRIALAIMPKHWERIQSYIEHVPVTDGGEIHLSDNYILTGIQAPSKKEEQYAFVLNANGSKLVFSGDEPLQEKYFELAEKPALFISEAFCAEADESNFQAHAKAHSTVLEAAQIANKIQARHLVLNHIYDESPDRAQRFAAEAAAVFQGAVTTPMTGDILEF